MKFKQATLVHRVIIRPYTLIKEKAKTGGVIDLSQVDDRAHAINSDRGEIFMIGPEAWKDFGCDTPPFKKGDKVYYAKYGAKTLKDRLTGDLYILCNDEDVLVAYTD